jgi:glycine betaine/proline transport system substrate-binding protein
LQVTTPAGSTDYTIESFKWAFAIQYMLWAIGIVQTLRYRRRTIRALSSVTPRRTPRCAAASIWRHRREESRMTETGPIVLGRIDESFHQVAAAVVEEVLLRLGHGVEVREGPHPQMYPLLERGEMDLFADSWLPGGHGVYWEQIRHQVVEVAPLFDGARFFWAVPGYIPAEVVSALPDLTRPEVTGRMATLVVQGTTPGAGLTMRSQELVRDYGLDEVGWSHRIGDLQTIIRTVNERIAAADWFVTPLWQPQYLNEVHDLRPLDDPRGVFPPPDRASLVAHRDAFVRLPERTRDVLRRIRFTVADVNAMDCAVNLHGLDPLAAARAWMGCHGDDVQAWLG